MRGNKWSLSAFCLPFSVLWVSFLWIQPGMFPWENSQEIRSHLPGGPPFVVISKTGELRISDGLEDSFPIVQEQLAHAVKTWIHTSEFFQRYRFVVIRADKETPYAKVLWISDILKNQGIHKIKYI